MCYFNSAQPSMLMDKRTVVIDAGITENGMGRIEGLKFLVVLWKATSSI
jgi:hypothetical protein